MELVTKRPRGTEDKLPKDIYKWHTVEKVAKNVAADWKEKEYTWEMFCKWKGIKL